VSRGCDRGAGRCGRRNPGGSWRGPRRSWGPGCLSGRTIDCDQCKRGDDGGNFSVHVWSPFWISISLLNRILGHYRQPAILDVGECRSGVTSPPRGSRTLRALFIYGKQRRIDSVNGKVFVAMKSSYELRLCLDRRCVSRERSCDSRFPPRRPVGSVALFTLDESHDLQVSSQLGRSGSIWTRTPTGSSSPPPVDGPKQFIKPCLPVGP
jgi:hypothetical protein